MAEKQIIDVRSPIYHACGGVIYRILPETTSDQVNVGAATLSQQLENINRAIAGSSTVRFVNSIAERDVLTNLLPGDRAYVLDASGDPAIGTAKSAMYIWMPDLRWAQVGETAAPQMEDYVQENGGLAVNGNRLAVELEETGGLNRTDEGRLRAYELCEIYHFRHPTLKPGFQPCMGGVISRAAEKYPEAWEYLQSSAGQLLLKTEEEWQAMTVATWHTCADGTTIGWNGIGGAPFFVQDLEAGTLRMPDLRGMFPEAAGLDSLGAGDAKGDATRNITATWNSTYFADMQYATVSGAALHVQENHAGRQSVIWGNDPVHPQGLVFNASRVVPTAAVNRPRSYGVLTCAYLGREISITTGEE